VAVQVLLGRAERALGATREQLRAWMNGDEDAPPHIYQAVADLLQELKKPRD